MGLHWCTVRLLPLCPQEVHCQGDLKCSESAARLFNRMYPNNMMRYTNTTSVGQVASTGALQTGWCRWWPTARIYLFLFPFLGLVFIRWQYLCNSKVSQSQSNITQGDFSDNTVSNPRNLYSVPNTFSGFAWEIM